MTAKLARFHGTAAKTGLKGQHLAEKGVDHVNAQAHDLRQIHFLVLGDLGRQVMLEVVPMYQRRVQEGLAKQPQHTHLPPIFAMSQNANLIEAPAIPSGATCAWRPS